jgi:phosphoglycolate phosphatase
MSKNIIFDFDGTLIDSEKAIFQCFHKITKKLAPERLNYANNILIGPPLRDTASEILGPNRQSQLNNFVNHFIEIHDEQAIKYSQPYPSVIETLKKLHSKGILMAIATNKRKVPIQKLIEHFSWQSYFRSIECSDSHPKLINKDRMIKNILNSNPNFENCYFVGDTVNDGISAKLNNLKFIKANYGYGCNQDWSEVNINKSIEKFYELELIIN